MSSSLQTPALCGQTALYQSSNLSTAVEPVAFLVSKCWFYLDELSAGLLYLEIPHCSQYRLLIDLE